VEKINIGYGHRKVAYRRALLVTLALALGQAPPAQAESTRVSRPLTVSGTVNAILPSVGVEVALQTSDRLALAVQVTQLLWAHVDVSARMRVFVVANEESGFYVGPILHAWYSPLILHGVSPVGTVEAGYELRAPTGFTFGIGLGGGVIWNPYKGSESQEWEPVGMLNLRMGKSW